MSCRRYNQGYGVPLQAVMAANTKKRLFGLFKTYRAGPKDNVGVFAELKYVKFIMNICNMQLLLKFLDYLN